MHTMTNNKQQTAMELLFLEFKSLSKVSRDAGDEQTANLIDFLCEREQQAKEIDKAKAFEIFKAGQDSMEEGGKGFEQYYNETFGNDKQ